MIKRAGMGRLRKGLIYLLLVMATSWGVYSLAFKKSASDVSKAEQSQLGAALQKSAQGGGVELRWAQLEQTEWGRDPFGTSPLAAPEQPEWILKAILFNPQRPLAYVNGRRVGVGDLVENAEIISIEPDRVTLRYRGREIELQVHEG